MTNRRGETVATAVTNMDIHDISRTARTFGMLGYFLVHPLKEQHQVVGRILKHWKDESQKVYHPDRFEALKRTVMVESFQDVKTFIQEKHGVFPEVVLTDARAGGSDGSLERENFSKKKVSYQEYRKELKAREKNQPVVIVFGTGWGIAPEFYSEVHRILPPVYGPEKEDGYNHLSVRSAIAIILDRLLGE